ncbi:Transcriptional regulatory protein AfsQ1 [Calidithermus terrae]|uniref:Transcriptional regulatory protein AfsQ1 n=2 Tax=Calidithermus terrae TaxID=1408545 RepID=A0A399EDB6_9DEIN|nr:Transcriptional regulatory protein AfsQ1 [Calidithermus terrae]
MGYRVLTASSGPEGLALARRERPGLVLLDLMMPGMGGFEVAERLREEGFAGSIVLISARDEAEIFERAARLGTPLLVKPVDLDALLSAVAWGVRPPP